jgi:hypothetical protein
MKDVWLATYKRKPNSMLECVAYQVVDETNGPGGHIGHTLTYQSEQHILMFGGRQRVTSSPNMFADENPRYPHLAHILDIKDKYWSKAIINGDIPEPRAHHTANIAGGKIFIGGVECNKQDMTTTKPPSYILTFDSTDKTFHRTKLDLPRDLHLTHHQWRHQDFFSGGAKCPSEDSTPPTQHSAINGTTLK